MKRILLPLLLILALACSTYALDVKVGASLELDYVNMSQDGPNNTKTKTGGWGTSSANIYVSSQLADNVKFWLKFDFDDDADQIEEIGLTFSKVMQDLDLKIGEQEVAFGGDFDMQITDPYTHQWEVDNKKGVTAIYGIDEKNKLEISLFENKTGTYVNNNGDTESVDNGLLKSYSARLTSAIMEGLDMSFSYMIQGTEQSGANIEDEKSMSVTAKYKLDDRTLLFGEYCTTSDDGNTKNQDKDGMQIGIKYGLSEKTDIVATYETVEEDDGDAIANDDEYKKTAVSVTQQLSGNVKLMAEYYTAKQENSAAGSVDLDSNSFSVRLACKF